MICFACAPNHTAEDGGGRNGTYTKHLLQHLATPQTNILNIMIRVCAAVKAETNGRQIPYNNSALLVEDAFLSSGVANTLPPAKPAEAETILMLLSAPLVSSTSGQQRAVPALDQTRELSVLAASMEEAQRAVCLCVEFARTDTLRRKLDTLRPAILHFSGHVRQQLSNHVAQPSSPQHLRANPCAAPARYRASLAA